jgi:hypothetical protein
LREWQEKFSDFFDELNWQRIGELSDLTSTHTLKPEEKAIGDAKIFGVADRVALGDFGRVVVVRIGNGEVLSGAEHSGGGSGVGHVVVWLVDAQSVTLGQTKRNIFFHVFSFFFLCFFLDRLSRA